jgi:hypothetical protein
MKIHVIVDGFGNVVSVAAATTASKGPSAAPPRVVHPEHTIHEIDIPENLFKPSDDPNAQNLMKEIHSKLRSSESSSIY